MGSEPLRDARDSQFCVLVSIKCCQLVTRGKRLIHWWLGVVPFYDFRYRLVRVTYLLQNLPQVAHCLNIHVPPPAYTCVYCVFIFSFRNRNMRSEERRVGKEC